MHKDTEKHQCPRVLRLQEVLDLISISRASHFAKLDKESKSYDPTYPKPISVGKRSMRYVEKEIVEWLTMQMEAR